MQIRNGCFIGLVELFNDFADLFDHRVIHFPVEQHFAGIQQKPFCPYRHQNSANDAHDRVEPRPAINQAACQCNDGQHRGGRVSDDMHVGRFQVQVVMVMMVMIVRIMFVCMVMMVIMRMAENHRASNIDQQADDCNDDRFLIMDSLRQEQAFHRAKNHHARNAEQENGTGKTGKDFYLPGAKGEPGIARITTRSRIGKGAQPDGKGMRAHVPAIRQQCHRVEPPSGNDLHHHHGGGNPHHGTRAPLCGRIAFVEYVMVCQMRYVLSVHGNGFNRKYICRKGLRSQGSWGLH